MNIDDLTLGQIKQLKCMLGGSESHTCENHPFVGRYVILRCYAAGVHAGILVSQSGDQAVLKNSRRLWRWRAASGIALSGVAQNGLSKSDTKVDVMNPEIALTGVIETIPCSKVAEESINGF